MPNTIKERVARLEEQAKFTTETFNKQVQVCGEEFERINHKLEIINHEQGETRDAINSLRRLVELRVSAPMSGRDKASIYIALISALSAVTVALISLFG